MLVIGLDAATFDILQPLIEAGETPAIASLMERGARCVLKSTIPPITPCAWTTFATGVNPGKHGVVDFRFLERGTYRLFRSHGDDSRSRSVWELLEDAGFSVGLYNLPWSDPRAARRGYIIGGIDSQAAAERCNPPTLAREITEAVGPEALGSGGGRDADGRFNPANLDAEISRDVAVTRYLLTHRPTDVFGAVFMTLDITQHLYYAADVDLANSDDPRAQIMLRIYKLIDNAVGQLLELVDEDTIILVASDHGAYPVRSGLNLDAVLADLGLLSYHDGLPHWSEAFARRQRLLRRLLDPIWHRVRNVVRRVVPRARGRIARMARPSRLFSAVDWSRTKVFCWGHAPLFRVNLQGREPHGAVRAEDYQRVCDEAVEALRAYKDPHTAEPVFDLVEKTVDLYKGPHARALVDIVALARDSSYATCVHIPHPEAPLFLDEQVYRYVAPNRPPLVAHHHPEGICILAGPGVPARADMAPPASIADIAPTLLYLLDQPIPHEMDGQVMSQLLGPARLAAQPPAYCDTPLSVEREPQPLTYGPEDARRVEERLRDLGYLE